MTNRCFVKSVLQNGGQITPTLIDPKDSKGLGLLNPSIFIEENGEPWCILRNVNYTEYHTENHQVYNNRWGPLSYLNPEDDLHLRTWNFLCKLHPQTLAVEKYWLIDTSKLDKEPLWEFVGLEDARLIRWDGKLYGIGVRRDTTTNGQGRMEYSRLEYDKRRNKVLETERYRIEHPVNPNWYCEKNWMPIIDMPHHFVQYTNPVIVIKADTTTLKSWHARPVDESQTVPDIPFLRGGSQVIPWNGYRICVVHEVDLYKNYLDQKDAAYRHRFVVWDREWNLVSLTEPFSFMGGELEFVCGAAIYQGDLIVGFSVQDNCAFHLRIPAHMIRSVLDLDKLHWGQFSDSPPVRDYIENEVITRDVYQQQYRVQEGDIVVDVGASVGPFIWSIKNRKPGRVIAVEPDVRFYKTLKRNCAASGLAVEIALSGISSVNEKFVTRGLLNSGHFHNDTYEGEPSEIDGVTFKTLVEQRSIPHIDFLKTDCEGAEYDIFNDENFEWIKRNVRHVAGEFHLHNKILNAKWLHFRDTYLRALPFSLYSLDAVELNAQDVWLDWFADHYKAVMVYIDNVPRLKWRATPYPSLEITATILSKGCSMRCAVCPQDKLVAAYTGVQALSYENFCRLIDKVPKEVLISFAGFTEPFLHVACAAMIRYAHERGHKVSVFTTGVGMQLDDLVQLRDIPFENIQGGFVLHLPDVNGYFTHTLTTDYLRLLEAIKAANLTGFEAMTMGDLPPELRTMFPNAIQRPLFSRAGNVDRPDVIKTEAKPPSTCGCQEKLYHNVLLPNGDVVLCCQDYGLTHVLGNLYKSSYDDIVPEDGTVFELCRHCENGKAL